MLWSQAGSLDSVLQRKEVGREVEVEGRQKVDTQGDKRRTERTEKVVIEVDREMDREALSRGFWDARQAPALLLLWDHGLFPISHLGLVSWLRKSGAVCISLEMFTSQWSCHSVQLLWWSPAHGSWSGVWIEHLITQLWPPHSSGLRHRRLSKRTEKVPSASLLTPQRKHS